MPWGVFEHFMILATFHAILDRVAQELGYLRLPRGRLMSVLRSLALIASRDRVSLLPKRWTSPETGLSEGEFSKENSPPWKVSCQRRAHEYGRRILTSSEFVRETRKRFWGFY